jgi:hypothetical protein
MSGAIPGRWGPPPPDEGWRFTPLDTDVANPARVYDYLLGGKDNFAADREVAAATLKIAPDATERVRENRLFLQRAVRMLAAEAGIRQFLDIGAGLPTQGNVHEAAQRAASGTRVVYVDNDPIVLTHGRALLAGDGSSTVVQADVREPDAVLRHPEVGAFLDLTEPVALLLVSILHFVTDAEDPEAIVARYRDALPSGSYLVLSHLVGDINPKAHDIAKLYDNATARMVLRSRERIERFFDGFELVDPGVVAVPFWRPDGPPPAAEPERLVIWGGVGRKA